MISLSTHMRPAVLALGLALAGCSSVTVTADYDPETDFSGLRSFAWIPDDPEREVDPRAGDPLISARVTEAVEHTLQAAGYAQVSEQADFLVGFTISVQRGTTLVSDTGPIFYGRYGHGGYGAVGYSSTTQVREYEEGVLQIDIVGTDSNTLLWRGTATAVLKSNQTPEQSTEAINEAVAKVLAQFPPD